jgi:hypothetical protein
MRRALTAALAAFLLPTGAALAAHAPVRHPHKVKLSGEIETLSSTGNIATPGVKDTDAGILNGTVAGSPRWGGALRQVVTWGSALHVTAKGTMFAADGSLRFTWKGRFAPVAGVGIELTGTMTVRGGTGRYAGARGHLAITGVATVSPGSTKSTFDLAGALRYR